MNSRVALSIAATTGLLLLVGAECALAQSGQLAPGVVVEVTPLPPSAFGPISHLPLEVDIRAAEDFVRLGFGPHLRGGKNFQSTEFLTPTISTKQAAYLVRQVPQYGAFNGDKVGEGILKFTGRVSGVQFGREGSPVLYFDLPYWTHQREGPVGTAEGQRISDQEHAELVKEIREIFVGQLGAEEFGSDPIRKRRVRIWWHH